MDADSQDFEAVKGRLEQIVDEVNAEGVTLDEALALYEEAVKLGLSACEVSENDLFPEPEPELEGEPEADAAAPGDAVQAQTEALEAAYEGSDIAEASIIEHVGDAASVQPTTGSHA